MYLFGFPDQQSPDHFNQIEESDADESRILREELEKRCEEDQGQGFHAQWEPVGELLPLAQRSHKKPKRAVVDQKLTLTDSELRSWFQDTSRYSYMSFFVPLVFFLMVTSVSQKPLNLTPAKRNSEKRKSDAGVRPLIFLEPHFILR